MPAVLATVSTVPTVTQNSLHPLSISSITAWHLLGFMVHGKITEADTPKIRLDTTPSRPSVTHLHHSPIYTPDALSATTLPLYPGLGQMTVHTQSLMTMIPWGGGFRTNCGCIMCNRNQLPFTLLLFICHTLSMSVDSLPNI